MISPPCALAIDEYKRATRNVARFWNLIYAVAAASAVTLCWFLLSVAVLESEAAIVPAVASVLGGAGVATLVKLKNDAYGELQTAVAAVRSDCGGSTSRGDAAESAALRETIAALLE